MTFVRLEVVDIFEVEQEITIKNNYNFQYNMEKFLLESGINMILDLDKLMYLNNSALGIIAHTAMMAKKNNKELVIAGIKQPISEIFEIVKFASFTQIFATRKEAIDYFTGKTEQEVSSVFFDKKDS